MIGMRRSYGIPESFGALVPGARWVIRDNDYNKLEWFEDYAPPTLDQVLAKQVELEAGEPVRVVREIRDWYLQQSDWTQGVDIRALRGPEWCAVWDTYRQQLRDITSAQTGFYFDEMNHIQGVTWPARPAAN
jgi:hypothetical protein